MIERQLQTAINNDLKKLNIKFLHLEAGRGCRNKTHRKGFPDLLILPGNGMAYFVELKIPGGKLSQEQYDFQTWALSLGYRHFTIFNMDQWQAFKKEIGL